MVQREGRILRKGNTNTDVLIYRYVSEGSFDSYSWQLLETKQRFISQFLTDSLYQRTASDLEDSVLSYAEVKALALSEPLMKQLAEKENEAQNLRVLIAKDAEIQGDLKDELNRLDKEIRRNGERINKCNVITWILNNTSDNEFEQAYKNLENVLSLEVVLRKKELREAVCVLGFKIVLPEIVNEKKPFVYIEKNGEQFLVEMGTSTKGNARRIMNVLKNFDKVTLKIWENNAKMRQRKEEIEKILSNEKSSYIEKLRLCEDEIEKIKDSMDIFKEFE